MKHRNANSNQELHHLYEIVDKKDNDVFKYGISSDKIDEDGLSRRVKRQLNFMNLIDGWARLFGRILKTNIPGRKAARQAEQEYIDDYEKVHGRSPRGNIK